MKEKIKFERKWEDFEGDYRYRLTKGDSHFFGGEPWARRIATHYKMKLPEKDTKW